MKNKTQQNLQSGTTSLCFLKRIVLFCLLGYVQGTIWAQQDTSLLLKVYPIGQDTSFLDKNFPYRAVHPDSSSLYSTLQEMIQQLHQAAFLEASIDTLVVKDSLFLAYLHVGTPYQWTQLSNGNLEDALLNQIGFREKSFKNSLLRYEQVQALQQKLLQYLENNGYPFATTWLDSIQFNGNEITAQLFLNKNKLILFDALQLEGDANISINYLQNYLGIKPGQLFSLAKVYQIKDRIRELPFVNLKKDPSIRFQKDKALVKLALNKAKASRFDFILGVLPRNEPKKQENQRLLLTGTFNGEFQNQFGLGEKIIANFEQLRPETQELNLQFTYPYVLELPFGIDLKLDLYKRDTTFLDLEYDIGIQYLLEGGNYLKVFWNRKQSTLLTINEDRILATQQLPDNLDVRNASFGLEYAWQKLNYRLNPRKGWNIVLRGGAGLKRIQKNNAILALDLENLYDSLQLRNFQYRVDLLAEKYIPIGKRGTIKIGLRAGTQISEQGIYTNEQYRIGGNKILRGFDEESLFVTQFGIGTLEYRFLIGENSYFYLFGDYAYIDKSTIQDTSTVDPIDFPFGFGTGIAFETKVGLFGLSLAFGSQQNNPIDFASPKVHFGYVSLF